MFPKVVLPLLLCFLSACSPPISVQTDYLSHENLASYQVGTPDPLMNNPPIGERLIISWSLPSQYLCYEDLHMALTVRLFTNEERTILIPIRSDTGTYIYSLINQDYFDTCGVQTFKIDIVGSHCQLTSWRHILWKELILFDRM